MIKKIRTSKKNEKGPFDAKWIITEPKYLWFLVIKLEALYDEKDLIQAIMSHLHDYY
jgi:hypothetical protein